MINAIRTMWASGVRRTTRAPGVWTLADLKPGQSARIDCVVCEHAARCERLMAYGLVKGQRVTLVQSSPAYVVRVDETELALDQDVARCIRLSPE